MLSFATDFPVSRTCTSVDFLRSIREWLIHSPHTAFDAAALADIDTRDEFRLHNPLEQLESIRFVSGTDDSAAIRYTKRDDRDDRIEWMTTIGFSRQAADCWIAARISCESQHPAARLPRPRKPVFVRSLLSGLGGGIDGVLTVQAGAHRLDNHDIDLAARCINGDAGCRLPIIYVSATFANEHLVDAERMADQLSGMAHVLVEPNRPFSIRLMTDVDSQNVYGGTIGIYWPDEGGQRAFFLGRDFENAFDIERAILDEVRLALTNRRPLTRCTWAAVQEATSRRAFNALREQGSTEIKAYIKAFDDESKAHATKLADAETEIFRLQAEIRKYQAQSPMQRGLGLRAPHEQDLYPGEIAAFVVETLGDACSRVPPDSRRLHVLKSIVDVNPAVAAGKERREQLKSLLRDFRSMDGKTRRGLETMGFAIEEASKHCKLVFQGDDRYTFTLPKSGSDVRGGLNAAGDIARLLF